MDGQDWAPLSITSKATTGLRINASNPQKITAEAAQARKIDHADGPIKVKQLSPESRQDMVKKRAEMKKTQAELNQLCSFPPNTIRDIESGKVTPSPGQLNTLNRILKINLKMI